MHLCARLLNLALVGEWMGSGQHVRTPALVEMEGEACSEAASGSPQVGDNRPIQAEPQFPALCGGELVQ